MMAANTVSLWPWDNRMPQLKLTMIFNLPRLGHAHV